VENNGLKRLSCRTYSCQSVIASSYFNWVVWKKLDHIRVHTLQETQQTGVCCSQEHC